MADKTRFVEIVQCRGVGSFKAGTGAFLLGAIACLTTVCPLAVADGYLTSIGPVPLRFAVEKPALPPSELPPLAMEDPAPAPVPETTETNTVAATLPDSPDRLSEDGLASAPSDSISPALSEGPTNAPASDLLVVTPQMLVEYFKPGLGNTNAANMVINVPVGFTPPAPVMIATPSSQATYRTQ